MEAIIVGAGVGGPAAALALRRAGIGAAVFEAHQRTTADVGSYLTLTPNGLDALRTLHALGPVVNAGFPTRKNIIWNDRGARLGTITLGKPLDDGTVAHTVKRARLSLSLQDEALKRGIRIEFGKRLVAAERDRARVVACFEDGKTAAGDLLIGADGIHSPTRKIIDQAAPAPRYLGLVNFGGYTPDAHLPYESQAWHLVFGKRAFFASSARRVAGRSGSPMCRAWK